MFVICHDNELRILVIRSASRAAPHSSKRGIDNDFNGATRDFAQRKDDVYES